MFNWRVFNIEGLERYQCFYNGNIVAVLVCIKEKWCCYNNRGERLDNKEYNLIDAQNLVEQWWLGVVNNMNNDNVIETERKLYHDNIKRLERQVEFERKESKELYQRLEEKIIELAKANMIIETIVKTSVNDTAKSVFIINKSVHFMCVDFVNSVKRS